ncbi:MAG: prohibitin family protein [Fusobacterium periodonticum]|nr:prohibitin family protein [Fusobacterium periodonticum]
MKKFYSLVLVLMALMISGCAERIDSGEAGVKVTLGNVSEDILTEGLHFYIPLMTDINVYNTKSKMIEMSDEKHTDTNEVIYDSAINILTKDNLSVPVDVTINYKLNKNCVPLIRVNYGLDVTWDNKIVTPKTRDVVRSVIGKDADVYRLNQNREVYTAQIQRTLTSEIDKMLGKEGCVEIDSVSIKNIKIPAQLNESILRKQQMEESVKIAELEIQRIKAEAQAEIEKNIGVAKAQKILTESISDKMIEWKRLEIEQQKINKWNGVTPTHVLSPDTSIIIK